MASNMKNYTNKETNKAMDNFKKYQSDCGGTCKTDSIFNKNANTTGKGDAPRNVGANFKKNYDSIFPNSYKPSWLKNK